MSLLLDTCKIQKHWVCHLFNSISCKSLTCLQGEEEEQEEEEEEEKVLLHMDAIGFHFE